MKQLTGFAALILFSIVSWTGAGNAAQESFEINLKELRPAPAGTGKTKQQSTRRSEVTKSQVPPEKGSSSYTVRPGDNLFVILMRHYNLSNAAAERLIPEVMRLNGISNPQGLTTGQRLTIPLPAPTGRQTKTIRKQLPQAKPVVVPTATPAPAVTTAPALPQIHQPQAPAPAPKSSVKPQTAPKQPVITSTLREVSISPASSCALAHEIAKQLNLLVPSTKSISGEDTLTAEHMGLKVVIACGLSPDKIYTYERLLAQHEMQLLAFTGTESGSHVIRKLANRLSLAYRQPEPDATGYQPSSYLFPAIGPNGQDILITIDNSKHEN